MNKVNRIITLLVVIISIALIYTVSLILLDNTGKINQGKYRVNDVVITSTVDVKDKNMNETQENITGLKLDVSQTNTLSMLISKDEKYNRMYIDNISVSTPKKLGKIYISQTGIEDSYKELTKETKEIEIYPTERDNQYFIELNIINENFLTDVSIGEEVNKIVYDGTILKHLDVTEEELKLNIKFDFNIIDVAGNKNTCKIKLRLPSDGITGNGIVVTKLPLSDFVFRAK